MFVAPTQRDARHGKTILRYGTMYVGTGIALSMLSTGLLVGFASFADVQVKEWWTGVAVFGAMTVLSCGLLFEGFQRRVMLDDSGISVRGWFGRTHRADWNEVVRVENWVASSKFVVRTPS